VRSRQAYALVLLILLQSWASFTPIQAIENLPSEGGVHVDSWNETPFRDVAVSTPFNHMSMADYSDVAIIINNESEVSRVIGYAFADARGIPSERIFLLTNESTPTGETINNDQFDTFFVTPIQEMIQNRNLTELNVLVTTKGVPLRVNGGTNSRASFDSEIALIGGPFASSIHADWYATSNYGLAAGNEMSEFNRLEQGYYLVTRLTGYDLDTALNLIEKTNNSFGQHGLTVLDLATNRNGSGYKWWNDLLYTTDATISSMGFPIHFNQNNTFVTDMENVSMYTSWGSNDGVWANNELSNSGYDTSDGSWSTGSRYWDGVGPSLSPGEQWWWARQTETKRNGNAAMEGRLEDAPCGANDASTTNGLLAEYFDNNGVTYNVSTMVNLSGRTPDFVRHEPNIDWPSTQHAWTGLDSRFLEYWSARHTGVIHIPTTGNWTFYLRSDDGSKLWIDDVEIVDNQGHHSMQEQSGIVWLETGEHELRTEFFEHGGYAGLELKWEGPGISKQTVPTNVLTRGSSHPVRESELIHHWEFDENSGDVANDSVGSAHLNFTGTNGSQWRTCVLGNCAFFDGVDDEARVDVDDMVTDFTVSLWVQANHSGQPRYSSAIAVNDVAGDDESFQIMASGGNPGNWELYHNNSYSFGTVDPTVWQHLVATFENDNVTLYIDGVEVLNQSVPNGTINSIELYKFGVNRAGSTHFTGVIDEVQIWETALSEEEVADVHDEIVWICPSFNTTSNSTAFVEQVWSIESDLQEHAWVLDGYSMREGWVEGDWWLEVESLDSNGTSLSTNQSDSRAFSDDWQSRVLRFRPHINATSIAIRQVAEFDSGTYNGSIFFDTLKLYPIRPHFTWLDGSIAETAVSTGGRTFTLGTDYGQSLVADLLEDGVSGVKGYVYEPYLSAISNPEQLFECYAQGFTLAECYAASNVLLSWMGVVVGDPKMAAYSNRLHDVNISDVRTPVMLSKDVNGTLEVLMENLAPAEAVGYLEVRDRQGSILLANISMTIPGGNDQGSRLILPVNITPVRTGYIEFIVRWIPANSHPERVIDNNLATLNTQINEGPEITGSICSTTEAARGGIVTCEVQVDDDFGVVAATLSWRLDWWNGSWANISAGSISSPSRWVASITLPADIPLTSVDLHWFVVDASNLSDSMQWDDAFTIVDAPSTWYGPHVEGVDASPWTGADTLSPNASGWIRGQQHIITACVIDLDHQYHPDSPRIQIDGIDLPQLQISSTSGSQTCYQINWQPPAGGSLEPIQMSLYAEGVEWANRTLIPIDLAPTAELLNVNYLSGASDVIDLQITDEDDPFVEFELSIEIEWPGSGSQLVTSPTVTAPAGLEQGEGIITATITNGTWTNLSWEWTRPVFLTPPILSAPIICEGSVSVDYLTRGVTGVYVWIGIPEGRPIELGGIQFSAEPGHEMNAPIETMIEMVPPAACTPGTGEENRYYRILVLDSYLNSFPLGSIEMIVYLRDIDGLNGFSNPLMVDFRGATPQLDFSEMPTDLTSGKESTLKFNIIDADGNDGTECSILMTEPNGITVISELFHPDAGGDWIHAWTPTGDSETNYTFQIACLDESGLSVNREILLRAREANQSATVNETTDETSKGPPSALTGIVIGVVGLFLLLLLLISGIFVSNRSDDLPIEEEVLPDDAWSKTAGEESDEILLEMAGLSPTSLSEMTEITDWTDEQLIEAGWSQEQIDAYREEE
jgi:uncharacterized protein (TIGR03790 family)